MFGNVTALAGLHVTGKYRDRGMQHTCSRRASRTRTCVWVSVFKVEVLG